MRYIINKINTFFSIKKLIYIVLFALVISVGINYITSKSATSEIAVIDEDKTELSSRLVEKIVKLEGFKKYEQTDTRVYKILSGFEEKIKRGEYTGLVDFDNLAGFELEQANLKIIEIVTELKVLAEINTNSPGYSYEEFDRDLSNTKSLKLINIVNMPSDTKTNITDNKGVYVFVIVILSIFLSNLYINLEIIEERRKLIIERLRINRVSRVYYYTEKYIKLILINFLLIATLFIVTKSFNMINIKIVIALTLLYFYSYILQLIRLDKNTYIVIYMIMFIVFAIIYIMPGLNISYLSPIEIISKI